MTKMLDADLEPAITSQPLESNLSSAPWYYISRIVIVCMISWINYFIQPMRLDEGWNQIQFNLADFTRRAYGTNYVETLRIQIHANCRIRRIYFSDRLYSEDELPAEFKLYLPVQAKAKV